MGEEKMNLANLKFPKTEKLCMERINFLESFIKSNPKDEKKIAEFSTAKGYWESCLEIINSEISKEGSIECFKKAILPYINFQRLGREKLEAEYDNQEKIQNQPYEESVKMSEKDFRDYTTQYEYILNNYDDAIREATYCLNELKILYKLWK